MEQKSVDFIKIWSVVVGVLSLSSLWTLSIYPVASLVGVVAVIAILLGLAVMYAGLMATSMDPKTVGAIFWTKFVWLIVNFLYSISGRGDSFIRLLIIVGQGVIVWFLIQRLKKLSPHHAAHK